MPITNILSSIIKSSDLFSSIQLLRQLRVLIRFNKKSRIATVEGGLLSIAIFVLLGMSLINTLQTTLQKTNISYVQTITNDINTAYSQVSINKQGNLMFGIRVTDMNMNVHDLNDNYRYFDIILASTFLQSGQFKHTAITKLQACTKEHWTAFPSIAKDFDNNHMQKWLCPPLNSLFGLQGSYMSSTTQSISLSLKGCNNQSNINNVCHPQQTIDLAFKKIGGFFLNFFYTNPVFNLQNDRFIDYKLNIDAGFAFSPDIGGLALMALSDFEIQTDTSVFPFSLINSVSGLMIDGNIIYRSSKKSPDGGYFTLFIMKSSASYFYKREVQKLSAIISYIGGLFGIFYSSLAFMNIYTDKYYRIKMIQKVFNLNKDNQIGKFCSSFTLFKALGLKFLELIRKVFSGIAEWTQKLAQYQDELQMQLDVTLLVTRLNKLENIIISSFSQDQLATCLTKMETPVKQYKEARKRLGNICQYEQGQKIQPQQAHFSCSNMESSCIVDPQEQIGKRMKQSDQIQSVQSLSLSNYSSFPLAWKNNSIKNDGKLKFMNTAHVFKVDGNIITPQVQDKSHENQWPQQIPCAFNDL